MADISDTDTTLIGVILYLGFVGAVNPGSPGGGMANHLSAEKPNPNIGQPGVVQAEVPAPNAEDRKSPTHTPRATLARPSLLG